MVYCKTNKKIENCDKFRYLEIKKTDGNIYYYFFKGFEKIEKIEDMNLYLAN